jgi:hypothetical protein
MAQSLTITLNNNTRIVILWSTIKEALIRLEINGFILYYVNTHDDVGDSINGSYLQQLVAKKLNLLFEFAFQHCISL